MADDDVAGAAAVFFDAVAERVDVLALVDLLEASPLAACPAVFPVGFFGVLSVVFFVVFVAVLLLGFAALAGFLPVTDFLLAAAFLVVLTWVAAFLLVSRWAAAFFGVFFAVFFAVFSFASLAVAVFFVVFFAVFEALAVFFLGIEVPSAAALVEDAVFFLAVLPVADASAEDLEGSAFCVVEADFFLVVFFLAKDGSVPERPRGVIRSVCRLRECRDSQSPVK